MKFLLNARHWFWIAPLVLGVVFIGGGIYMITQGNDAKDEVRSALVAENITSSEDAAIPNVRVDDAATAKAQAEVINKHYLELTDGKTYAELDREDPNRETAFRAASLRTSLNLAVMGLKVSDLVIGLGAFMMAMGATFILFLSPAVYWAAEVAREHDAQQRREASREAATQTAS